MLVIKRAIMSIILLDNFVSNLVKKPFKTAYKLDGTCKKCGKCCREIALAAHPAILSSKLTTEIVARWISWIFDFFLVRVEYDKNYLIFGCKNLGPDGKCLNYRWRPNVCRNYPIVDYFDKPVFYPWCGYISSSRLVKTL